MLWYGQEEKGQVGTQKGVLRQIPQKGEHKRCNRCPCLDMAPFQRRSRFLEMGIPIIKKAPETV